MFPPLTSRSGQLYMKPDVKAALTEWRPSNLQGETTFDSEERCEAARSSLASKTKDLLRGAPNDIENRPLQTDEQSGKWIFALEVAASRCVSSDDPNLKAK